ncbi:MAG TPA: hypothetical protein PK160_01175 [Bacillota bacterium]|nr:hypothetical protein [Bacillota bacterium]
MEMSTSMDKEDKDIKKEIEELEKLIEEVKKQNEEEKKKQKKNIRSNGQIVVKINLGAEYSRNMFVNLLINFLVNLLVIFVLFNIINWATITSDVYFLLMALILTFYEELYRRYLIRYFMSIVVFSSGMIFFLMNLLLFYFLDLVVFQRNLDFNDHWYPIVFVMFLQIFRTIVRWLYIKGMSAFIVWKSKKKGGRK